MLACLLLQGRLAFALHGCGSSLLASADAVPVQFASGQTTTLMVRLQQTVDFALHSVWETGTTI